MSSSQANSHRHSDGRTEPGVSREAPPLKTHMNIYGLALKYTLQYNKYHLLSYEIFRGGASLETPGSERGSVRLWELACEDDIYSASPARILAFLFNRCVVYGIHGTRKLGKKFHLIL